MVYEPREDSALLARAVKKYARGHVLDMGTGTGFLAQVAASKNTVSSVLGVDIDERAVAFCKRTIKDKKIKFKESDLFSKITGTFDTIIFNPPYLPRDKEFHDIALHGGKRGYETICTFLENAGDYLTPQGTILLLFSSLSKQEKVLECLGQNLFEYKEFTSQRVFFEDLFVHVIKKKELRRQLEKKGVTSIRYLDHGKRGVVYTGKYKQKKVAMKTKRESSEAFGRLRNEAKWLDHLRDTGMCPQLLFSDEHYIVYEYVEGTFLPEFLMGANKSEAREVLIQLIGYCRHLDKLGINKEEMTRPIKHVLINEKPTKWRLSRKKRFNVVMIDFERTRFTSKPHNVTQFVQFLNKDATKKWLRGSVQISSKILDAAQVYKKDQTDENFKKILECIR